MKTKPDSKGIPKAALKATHLSPRWEHFMAFYNLKIKRQSKSGK